MEEWKNEKEDLNDRINHENAMYEERLDQM